MRSTLRLPAWPPWLRDAGLIALAAAVLAVELRAIEDPGSYLRPDSFAALLYLTALAMLLLRRRTPHLAAGAVLTLSYTYQALGYVPLAALELMTLVVLFSAAAHGRPLPRAVPFAGLALWLLAVNAAAPLALGWSGLAILYVVLVSAWLLGERERSHRRYLAMLEERAALLERQHALETAEVESAERARIARELHDVIAHGLGVVVVQAEAALHSPGAVAPETHRGIEAIRATSRSALNEARRILGVLRAAPGAPPPAHGIEDLPRLAEEFATAGLRVDLAVEGDPRPLDPGAALSVYRVVEEALTNTLRHARATRALVRLEFRPDALAVLVHDDGAASVAGPPGHGLVGMRERAAMLNAAFEAGPDPAGGYTVRLVLPLPPAEAATRTLEAAS